MLTNRSTVFFSQHLSRTINIISLCCWIIPLTIMMVWFSSTPCQGFRTSECDYLFLMGFTFRYMVLSAFLLPLILMSIIYLRIFILISRHQRARRLEHKRSATTASTSAATRAATAAIVSGHLNNVAMATLGLPVSETGLISNQLISRTEIGGHGTDECLVCAGSRRPDCGWSEAILPQSGGDSNSEIGRSSVYEQNDDGRESEAEKRGADGNKCRAKCQINEKPGAQVTPLLESTQNTEAQVCDRVQSNGINNHNKTVAQIAAPVGALERQQSQHLAEHEQRPRLVTSKAGGSEGDDDHHQHNERAPLVIEDRNKEPKCGMDALSSQAPPTKAPDEPNSRRASSSSRNTSLLSGSFSSLADRFRWPRGYNGAPAEGSPSTDFSTSDKKLTAGETKLARANTIGFRLAPTSSGANANDVMHQKEPDSGASRVITTTCKRRAAQTGSLHETLSLSYGRPQNSDSAKTSAKGAKNLNSAMNLHIEQLSSHSGSTYVAAVSGTVNYPVNRLSTTTSATASGAKHSYEPQRRHVHAQAVPQTNTKALVTTLLILGTYFITYAPAIIYQVLTCIDHCPYPLHTISFSRRVLLGAITTVLLIIKSIVDPLIYSYRMHEIQQAIGRYLSKRRSRLSESQRAMGGASLHTSQRQTATCGGLEPATICGLASRGPSIGRNAISKTETVVC